MAQSSNMPQSSKGRSKFDPYEHFNIALKEDGSLIRFAKMPAAPATGEVDEQLCDQIPVASKDVVLDAEKSTYLRIYRPTKLPPSNENSGTKIPIMICFHASGFVLFNINNAVIHETRNRFAGEIPTIAISVGYRLAPENRLPAQYEDAIDAIKWVRDQALDEDGDPWLRDYGDFSRCYLYGKSAGGNIAFHAALKAAEMKLDPISIVGLVLNQPLFGGVRRTKSEIKLAADPIFPLPGIDLIWELSLPQGTNRDHRFSNPFCDPVIMERMKRLGRVLVIGFAGDPLYDRQQALVKTLVSQGIPVDARFDDLGFHCVDIIDNRIATAIVGFVKEFVV